MKILILGLLLVGCGVRVKTDKVQVDEVTVRHIIELPDIESMCADQNIDGTEEDLNKCIATWKEILKLNEEQDSEEETQE